jgi:hypothetical protein
MKNRAAIYVEIPTCRAFSTTFRFEHRREYSCWARLSFKNRTHPTFGRIFTKLWISKSRTVISPSL